MEAPAQVGECTGSRSVLAWGPWLWSHVLFGGAAPSITPWRWRALFLLLILPGALLYPALSFRLFEPDEGRYAEIPREMLARGELVVPYLQGEPYLDKPPLMYWLVMGSYVVLGVHDWSARLVPALAIHGCIFVTYFLGRRRLGERAAFWGALILSLAPGFMSIGRLLVLDGLLALCVTTALFAVFEATSGPRLHWAWWLTGALACGLGILTKGPVELLLLFPPWWLFRRLSGQGCRVGWPAWIAFLATALAVCLPWYTAICIRLPAFAGYFFWVQNVQRFLAPFDHLRPVWFYGPILLGGLLPGTLLAIPFVRFLVSGSASCAQRRCPALGWALGSGLWCVLFFSLSGSKLPTYILPAYPPLALALGYYISQSGWHRSRLVQAGVTVMALAMFAGHTVIVPAYALFHSPLADPDQLGSLCADASVPVVCYPRNCDSVAFYLHRDDLHSYRSKYTHLLVQFLKTQQRTVVVFTHRHALQGLREAAVPARLRLWGDQVLGLTTASRTGMVFTALRRLLGESRDELYYLAIVEPCR